MKNVGILFPGQGSQYIGMGKSIYDNFAIAKQTFEEANEVLGYDLRKICFNGTLKELNSIDNMLAAILTTSIANYRIFMQEVGMQPAYMAGHSLGEYSALACSGALEFTDALKIVRVRSLLAQEAAQKQDGVMTIVENTNKEQVEKICRDSTTNQNIVCVSLYNSQSQFTICGHNNAVMDAEGKLLEAGAKITPIMMGAPFHSSLMKDAATKLGEELSKYNFKKPKCNIISNVTATPYKTAEMIINNLINQLVMPVKWDETMKFLNKQNLDLLIDIGPQNLLQNMSDYGEMNSRIYSFNQKNDKKQLLDAINENKLGGTCNIVTQALALAVSTKNKNWNNDEYNKGVVENYRIIETIQNELDESGNVPTYDQMHKSLQCLRIILMTKKVELDEQNKMIRGILESTGQIDTFSSFTEGRI
ncbi:ACP S-malonyltransferase [Clostridium botulinum]|uniref:ACP S-malonyltransferase n=1 Tax=Clostridium botulinum TaxID=1491 RepID=UPI001968046D|nr:ACP S-malonyltransferase [Clostridium botulinum]MBN1050265.1 [acyl-carrier-protein] S-malonyltransferase [Clostridium botulinum]